MDDCLEGLWFICEGYCLQDNKKLTRLNVRSGVWYGRGIDCLSRNALFAEHHIGLRLAPFLTIDALSISTRLNRMATKNSRL